MMKNGLTDKSSYAEITQLVTNQAYMLATNDLFWLSGILFLCLLILIWFSRPPFFTKASSSAE